MRLHRLELENLNSLRGSTVIHFDEGPLGETPLFLIHGPTGAGKSTLMDAVSLALFAATARLGRDTSTRKDALDAEDPRHVMTRGTGSCMVRLVFSRLDGNRRRWFRAGWSVRRARSAPDGAFQNVQRELVELAGPDPDAELPGGLCGVGHRKADYNGAFEQALAGMTREDFQRTMLLAQGEFAAFLQSGRDERSAILKRVVDTTYYRELGARAAARWRTEKEKLVERETRLQAIELLSHEDRSGLEAELDEVRSARQALERESKPLEERRRWVGGAIERWGRLKERRADLDRAVVARAQRAGDAGRLEAHRMAEPALRELDARDGLAKELDGLTSGIREVEGKLEKAREPLEACRKAEAEAEGIRDRTQEDREKAQPELAQAREVAKRRAVFDRKKSDDRTALASAKRALDTACTARETQARKVAELQEAAAGAREQWKGIAPWHDLVDKEDALAPIQSRVETFQGELRTLAEREEALDRARRKMGGQDRDLEEARGRLRPLEEAVLRARTGLPSDGEPQEAPDRIQALRKRQERLGGEIQALEEVLRTVDVVGSREARHGVLVQEVEEGQTAAATSDERATAAERLTGEIQAHVETARLSAQREAETLAHLAYHVKLQSDLREGEPCAVCGSTDHPARGEGPPPQLAEARDRARKAEARAESDVKAAEARLREARRAQAELDDDRTRLRTRLEGKEEELSRLQDELNLLRKSSVEGWRAANGVGEPTREAVHALLTGIRERREAAGKEEAQWTSLDQAHRKVSDAFSEIRTLKAGYQAATEAVQVAEGEVGAGRSRVGEAREALAGVHASLPTTGAGTDLPVEAWTGEHAGHWLDGIRFGLGKARGLRQALDQAERALEAGERELETRKEEEGRAAAETQRCEAVLRETTGNLEVTALEQARYFDGEDPEKVAIGLDRKMMDAQRTFEAARQSRVGLESAWNSLNVTLRERNERRDELGPRVDQARQKTQDLLETAKLSEEQARAVRLSEEVVARLEGELSDLDQRLQDAGSRHDEAEELWRAHEAARPEEEPGPECGEQTGCGPDQGPAYDWAPVLEARRGELDEAIQEVSARLNGARDRLARLDERRIRDDDLRARRQRELDELARARLDAAMWEELAALIGTREGAAFEEFAQSLVLDRILAGANEHLNRLRPRYRFVRPPGSEGTFAVVVRDSHLAGQERPLTTLSGGETFLAALALALGLAGMSTQDLPIETLLLDEGFGTLDPASLEDAITVLESLHERGYRVGLISHVEALRERIGRGIQVRPMGGGFSEVVVDGG